ncbi:MAG: M56 family metallopeptidase [Bacteroidia bacterium]|nr:M56 family metallopeptidase [Bacteroidia bacterium]
MEIQLFIYIAKVNVALLLFYLLYITVFRHDTFIRFRRIYLLSAIVFTLIYPFFSINALGELFTFPTSRTAVEASILIDKPTAILIAEESVSGFSIPWKTIGISILILGTLFFTIRFLWQVISILRIRYRSEKKIVSGYYIYNLSDDITPFSFFQWIFLHTESYSEEELQQILFHEYTHARQWHSVDIILSELLCILFWWNPAVWLIKREITINLEYLADNDVLLHGINSKEYQYHLLKLTYHKTAVQIGNNFNVSQLKKRIMMMNKTKSPAMKLAKYLLVVPLTFLLITLNSCLSKEKKNDENTTTETISSLPDTSDASPEVSAEEPKGEVYVVVEEQPTYPEGNAAMMKFLGDNIKYPVEAQEKKIQGRVIANFVVEKDGSLSDIQVVRGVDPLLDAEAIRVLKLMPNWKPGKQSGENVRVRFTFPVVFRLQSDGQNTLVPPPPPPPPLPHDKKTSVAPSPPPPSPAHGKTAEELKNTNEVFIVVEKQPEFPEGNAAMMRFLNDNIKYPAEAKEKRIQGRVIVNFIVDKDGSLTDITVVRGTNPLLDAEAIRVIQAMPNWKPGMQRGQVVRVRFTLSVVFKLQK